MDGEGRLIMVITVEMDCNRGYICLARSSWDGVVLTPQKETGLSAGDRWGRQDDGDRRTQQWRRDDS